MLRQVKNGQKNMQENRFKGLEVRVPDHISSGYGKHFCITLQMRGTGERWERLAGLVHEGLSQPEEE